MEQKPFYTASKTKHAHLWRELRDELGMPVTATWIDEAEPGMTADLGELAGRCVEDIRRAAFLLLYTELGEVHKGAAIEVGIALALGKEVRCVGPVSGFGTAFPHHPLWKNYGTITGAVQGAADDEG